MVPLLNAVKRGKESFWGANSQKSVVRWPFSSAVSGWKLCMLRGGEVQVICNAICGLSPRANSLTGTLAGNSGITISSKRFALFEIIVGFTSVPTGYTHIAYPLSQLCWHFPRLFCTNCIFVFFKDCLRT